MNFPYHKGAPHVFVDQQLAHISRRVSILVRLFAMYALEYMLYIIYNHVTMSKTKSLTHSKKNHKRYELFPIMRILFLFPLLTSSSSFHVTCYFPFVVFQCDGQHEKTNFQMIGWEILIFHTKLKIKSYLFKYNEDRFKLLTMLSPNNNSPFPHIAA